MSLLGPTKQRAIITIVCIVFVANLLLVPIYFASAQLVVTDPTVGTQTTIQVIKNFLKKVFVGIAGVGLTNALDYFMQKIAYDLAVGLATGGKGQMPLFSSEGWGNYFKSTALDAVGEFAGSLTEEFGVDICNPGSAFVKLKIQTSLVEGLLPVKDAPRPSCTWNELSDNWDDFTEDFSSGDVLKKSGVMFEPGETPLGITLDVTKQMRLNLTDVTKSAEKEREEGGGFLSQVGIISEKIQTPGALIKKKAESMTEQGDEKQKEQSSSLSRSISAGSFQILTSALSTFVNTLAGKLLERLFEGMFSLGDLAGGGKSAALINPEFALVGTREVARELFSDFITPPIKETEVYDMVLDFTTCPSQFANSNNCVIDQSFSEAIRREQAGDPLSVREAIDQGLLHGEWPLISSFDRARNTDTYCYTYGYCYSNLVKLRKARIIPIGWEVAAQKSGTVAKQATLEEVMESFHDCGVDDEGRAAADDTHPWCHMIDPDWVIKYPLTQCRAMVYGPTLVTAEGDMRTETCVDAPSCIAEDDEGNCVGGWGYCTREKNVWHLDGDICPARYESCLTLADRNGNENSYLLNTVNFDACYADNVGCLWYSNNKTKSGDDWVWQASTSYNSDDYALIATDSAIYFDKDAEECSAGEDGCTEMVRASAAGATLNLVQNPGFENGEEPTLPDSWAETLAPMPGLGPRVYDTTGDQSYEGVDAVSPGGPGLLQIIKLNPARFYTMSVYAENPQGLDNAMAMRVIILQSDGTSRLAADLNDYYYTESTCRVSDFGANGQAFALRGEGLPTGVVPPDQYERYTCTFTTPGKEFTGATGKYFVGRLAIYGDVWVDAVQVEESEIPTVYHEGISAGAQSIYLRKPPAYLGCEGSADDDELCGNYLRPCSPMDVGCKMYYPQSGDPDISAVATAEDICPAQCVGYETFREEPTQWSVAAQFPLFFIPDSALECAASQVGCDEFTSLDAPEAGGETLNYFTEIRMCQKPGPDSETFYTWEGSDTTGYQLKTWVLKGSNLDDGPCTTLAPGGVCNDDDMTARDCSDLFGIDADCREFYNTAGDIFYRKYSDTIISTDECYRFRKTQTTGQTDCEATGGTWTEQGECIYMGYSAESIDCPAEMAGCRAYTGPTSRNIEQEFLHDFEDATNQGWEGGAPSTESVTLGGHSLKISARGSAEKTHEILDGQTYTLSFWAKGRGEIAVSAGGVNFGAVEIGAEWNEYNIGPVLTAAPTDSIILDGSGLDVESYFDNILLKRVSDHVYLIRHSWYTPLACDMNNQGVYIPQAQLGCEAYYDDEGTDYYFKSFSRLCSDDAVGCEGMIDTFNSTSSYEQIFQPGEDGAEVTVAADTVAYYVYDDSFSCTADVKGCEVLGRPKLSQDGRSIAMREDEEGGLVPDWDDVYLINDPERYDEILCKTQDAFCDEFSGASGKYYFKHPQNKLCEWKEKVKVSGIEYNGWFRKGTEQPCYPAYLGGGNTYGLWRNGDSDYEAWVGLCPKAYNMCTKFIDPSDASDQYPEGRDYYYLNNDKLDQSTCQGNISKKDGCVLFDNTVSTTKDYNSWATYLTSEDKNYETVPAVDCRSSDSPYCEQVCTFWAPGVPTKYYMSENCREDSDCGSFTYRCENINEFGKMCRDWNPAGNDFVYQYADGFTDGLRCETNSDCPDGQQCVDMSQELRGNNSNMILKVRRDRECGEWLSCRSSATVWDNETSQYKNVCTDLGLCNEYSQTGEASECVNFIESEHAGDVLTEKLYSSRDISWEGQDYSSYSIPNYYSIDEIHPIDLSRITGSDVPDLRLGHAVEDPGCAPYQLCGDANSLGNRGVCLDGSNCVYSINGEALPTADTNTQLYSALNTADSKMRLVGSSCRAYPEESSPFPSGVAVWEEGRMSSVHPDFKKANICEQAIWQDFNNDNKRDANELSYQDCDCDYIKVTYGTGAVTKYYSINETKIPKGICMLGTRDGLPCVPGLDYNDELAYDDSYNLQTCGSMKSGGTCQTLERSDTFVGWQGQCLEQDLATNLNADPAQTACLTWHPSYILAGGQDIYNLYQSAGYNPGVTGRYWCALGQGLREVFTPLGRSEDYEAVTRSKEMYRRSECLDWKDACLCRPPPPGVSREHYEDCCCDKWEYSGYYEGHGPNSRWSRLVWGGTKDGGDLYKEIWMPALTHEKYNLDSIIAIELVVEGAEAKDWPNGRNSYTNDFYKDGNNILSRENELFLPDGWRAWQTTWNLGETEIPSTFPPVFVRPSLIKFDGLKSYNSDSCGWEEKEPPNYFAIRAVFDDKGNFRGFWTGACDDSSAKGWVDFKVIFHMAENCEVLAGVMDELGNAKAYTDRLYQATNYGLEFARGAIYQYNQTFAPFGSAQSLEAPLIAPSPGSFAWISGDNLKENSIIGTPDLSYFGESYTLGGSPLSCRDQCGKDGGSGKLYYNINKTPLEKGLDVLRQLFAKVQSLFYWLPGADEKVCRRRDGGEWQYIIPCGEETDCDTGGICELVSECVGGIFEGRNCAIYEYEDEDGDEVSYSIASGGNFCQGQEPLCLEQDIGSEGRSEIVYLCANSVRSGDECSKVDNVPDTDGGNKSFIIKGTLGTINIEDDKANNNACNAIGKCIDWNQHADPTETDYRCYGSIKHSQKCSGSGDCQSDGDCDRETKLCTGAWQELGINKSCSDHADCLLTTSRCSTGAEVKRCSSGVMDGARCEEDGSVCARDLTCQDKYEDRVDLWGLPSETRGYVQRVCSYDGLQALNNPCETADDCDEGRECVAPDLSPLFGTGFNFESEVLTDTSGNTDIASPPTVAAINFTQCDQVTGTCRIAKLDGFDVNNWYYGIITGQEQLKATIRFYAWADHDQMPIVSRTVDWGDSSPLDQTTLSKYKNQKPHCGTSVKECSGYEGLTCKTSADCPPGTGSCQDAGAHFGNDPNACSQGYFQFEHTYICDGSNDLDPCTFTDTPPDNDAVPAGGCRTSTACFFRPRVQVLDNWGWCNGDCDGDTVYDEPLAGCYANPINNQCAVAQERYSHWTRFDGYIKVNK